MSVAAFLLGLLVGLGSREIPVRLVPDETAWPRRLGVATFVVVAGFVVAWGTGLLLDLGFLIGLLTGTWVIPVLMLARRSGRR